MIEIKDLLSRFNKILLSKEGKKESVRKAISSVLGEEIDSKDVKIKNNIIYLNIKPIYKNEIFIKQDQIFLKLKDFFGENSPRDIR